MLGGFAVRSLFPYQKLVSPLPPTDSIMLSLHCLGFFFFFSYHSTPSTYSYTFLIYYKYCLLPVPPLI